MKQFCLWGERKVSLFHTPSTGLQEFPTPFQLKRKNEDVKKRGDPHYDLLKINKNKTGRKFKENKLFKLK